MGVATISRRGPSYGERRVGEGSGSAPAAEDVEEKAEHEAAGCHPALLTRTPLKPEHEL